MPSKNSRKKSGRGLEDYDINKLYPLKNIRHKPSPFLLNIQGLPGRKTDFDTVRPTIVAQPALSPRTIVAQPALSPRTIVAQPALSPRTKMAKAIKAKPSSPRTIIANTKFDKSHVGGKRKSKSINLRKPRK
jgi:hypothetical protein